MLQFAFSHSEYLQLCLLIKKKHFFCYKFTNKHWFLLCKYAMINQDPIKIFMEIFLITISKLFNTIIKLIN